MEVEEEHVHTLLSMGFPESEIRRALRRAKNDLNEAVAYLTNDQTLPSDWEEVDDVEMKDIHSRPSQTMYSPSPPPSYDDVHAMEVSFWFCGHYCTPRPVFFSDNYPSQLFNRYFLIT